MAFWLPALKILGPAVASALLSKGGGGGGPSGGSANPQLTEQSGIETDLLRRQREVFDMLLAKAKNFEGGPIGRLDLPDSRFLDEDFLGSLEPSRDIDLLKSLLGAGVGNSATRGLAGLESQRQQLSESASREQGQSIAGIIDALLTGRGQGQAPAEQPSALDVYRDQLAGAQGNQDNPFAGLL